LKLIREFLRDPIKAIQEISSKYGDISYFKLGRQPVYLINNPDYIEKVLVSGHRSFTKSKGLQVAKALLGEGLVTSEGDLHIRQRRIIQPIFHPKQVSAYGKIVTKFANNMDLMWRNGQILDISKEMMKLTVGIISKSVLNYDVESEAEGYGKALTTLRNHGKRLQSPLGNVINKIPILPNVKGAKEARKKLDELVYRLIRERREAIQSDIKDYDDLLSHLLQAQDSGKSGSTGIDKTDAGFASNTSIVGMSDKQVLRESMRLFPPVWMLSRNVDTDFPLDNYIIPAAP